MEDQVLFSLINNEKVFIKVVCCSRNLPFNGLKCLTLAYDTWHIISNTYHIVSGTITSQVERICHIMYSSSFIKDFYKSN